jgi:adenosylcobinamide-GDP ribazoletransferase
VNALRAQGRALAGAFTFMTRVPLGALATHDPADLPASAVYFPVVGLAVGGAAGVVYIGAARVWPSAVAITLSMIAGVLLTGAFHEDALADACDGFGGGWSREQVLAIMKDSRVGSYALVGVTLTLALKFATLTALAAQSTPIGVPRALILAHVLARWSSLPLIRRYDYVRSSSDGDRASAGRPFVAGVSNARLAAGTALTLIILVVAGGRSSLAAAAAAAAAAAVTALAGRYFARRIGGITGDALGAANQIVEVSVYLALTVRLA